jgi:hypothetical protein
VNTHLADLQLTLEMIDNAAAALAGEQFYDDVPHDAPAADTLAALGRVTDAIRTLRGVASHLEHDARHDGATFALIAAVTGTTTQAAQERHARRLALGARPDPDDPNHPSRSHV